MDEDCLLTAINDTSNCVAEGASDSVHHVSSGIDGTSSCVADGASDSVHHAASSIGGTADKTSLRPNISTTFKGIILHDDNNCRNITHHRVQETCAARGRSTRGTVCARGTPEKAASKAIKLTLLAAREPARETSDKAGLSRYQTSAQMPRVCIGSCQVRVERTYHGVQKTSGAAR